MTRYIARRLIQSIPLLILISIVMFAILQVLPGGPLTAYEQNTNISAADYQRLVNQLGINDPLPVKYAKWAWNILQGNWGYSISTQRPALVEIADRFPNTLYLMSVAMLLTLLLAIPIGILSAIKQYSWFDHLATTIAFAGQSIPIFWFGLILIIVFDVTLRWFPGGGMRTLGQPFSMTDYLWHLVLPVTMLALHSAATYTRYLRASMLDVIHQDYIRTARAKGLAERMVTYRHAFRNAALSLVTVVALDLPVLFVGAIFTETIFGWPGMGRLFIDSAQQSDYPVLMAFTMIAAGLIVFFNLAADVTYAFLDPRIRYD